MAKLDGLCLIIILCGAVTKGETVNSVRRSDDVLSLEHVVQQLSAAVNALQAKVTSQHDKIQQLEAQSARRVALSAYTSSSVTASSGTTVPFSGLITNIGNHYNPHTGIFTCPYDGDYFFSVIADVSVDYDYLALAKNGVAVTYADRDDDSSTLLTANTVVSLQAGDTVYVIQHSTNGSIDSGRENTFTGFLVR